jgi:5-methyltetrahydrofolate corrinoid/iron sulfur protein methyltransferase
MNWNSGKKRLWGTWGTLAIDCRTRTTENHGTFRSTRTHKLLLAADNIHGLNPVVADAMQNLKREPIQDLVKKCEEAGAEFIDINPGYLSRKNEDRMGFLVETVQEEWSLQLILDSPNSRILQKGLEACRGTPILNAISMEEHKLKEILPLGATHQADVIVLLMNENSFTPATVEEKVALALELSDRALAAGLSHDSLIFDPILPSLSWDDASPRIAAAATIVRLLSSGALFGRPAKTICGLSNLRSGFRKRFPWAMEQTCLAMLAGAGLDIVLANVLQPGFSEAFRSVKSMVQ